MTDPSNIDYSRLKEHLYRLEEARIEKQRKRNKGRARATEIKVAKNRAAAKLAKQARKKNRRK